MSINPLILLEKAINEHGSSVILKERLKLVKDQLAKVEAEKAELKSIQNENSLLKTGNNALQLEIELLKDKITKLEKAPSLSKNDLSILQYIANCENLVLSKDVIEALAIKPVQTDFHIQNLVDLNYIAELKRPIQYDSKYNEIVYSITQSGRRYLYDNKLL